MRGNYVDNIKENKTSKNADSTTENHKRRWGVEYPAGLQHPR